METNPVKFYYGTTNWVRTWLSSKLGKMVNVKELVPILSSHFVFCFFFCFCFLFFVFCFFFLRCKGLRQNLSHFEKTIEAAQPIINGKHNPYSHQNSESNIIWSHLGLCKVLPFSYIPLNWASSWASRSSSRKVSNQHTIGKHISHQFFS